MHQELIAKSQAYVEALGIAVVQTEAFSPEFIRFIVDYKQAQAVVQQANHSEEENFVVNGVELYGSGVSVSDTKLIATFSPVDESTFEELTFEFRGGVARIELTPPNEDDDEDEWEDEAQDDDQNPVDKFFAADDGEDDQDEDTE